MMDNREQQEEKNKRIGVLVSVGVQLVLLVLFYFIVAWKAPYPPIPEYGIELSFTSSPGNPSQRSSEAPSTEAPDDLEEVDEPVKEENTPQNSEAVSESEPEKGDFPIADPKQEVVSEAVEPNTNNNEVAEEKPAQPKVDSRAVMGGDSQKESEDTEQEDAESKTVDSRAIYGSQGEKEGEATGASLAMSGWVWDFEPRPNDTSDESGSIVFKITVDDQGYLIKIETLKSTVSPAVERKYREVVEKLTFSKTTAYKTAPISTGTITFIIKSR